MPSRRSRQKTPLPLNSVDSYAHLTHNSRDPPSSRTNADTGNSQPAPEPPTNWPVTVEYLSRPIQSPYLSNQQRRWLHHKPQPLVETNESASPVIKLPLSRTQVDSIIEIRVIDDENHPAHGQRGLFAARTLAPGALIVPYIGYVHSSTASEKAVKDTQEPPKHTHTHTEDTPPHDSGTPPAQNDRSAQSHHTAAPSIPVTIGSWDTSSYDLNLHRDSAIELAIDALQMGNEARFCNDYRGVPAQTDSNISSANTSWDRRQKRSVKSWNSSGGEIGAEFANPMGIAMAIPNAEFRDVCFEWTGNDNKIDTTHDGRVDPGAENEQGFQAPSMGSPENGPDSKQARRRRRRKNVGMRGVAIFVMPAGKAGKRKDGIKAGQEVLVSYGKGFWSHHGVEDLGGLVTEAQELEAGSSCGKDFFTR